MISQTKKILVIAPSWVGDMVMAQSLLKLLHQQRYQIDVAAPHSTFPLLQYMPEIDHAWRLPFARGKLAIWQRFRYGMSLRDQSYDWAIILPNSWKSALLPFFAGIKQRTGWQGEVRYGLLNDCRVLNKKKLPLMVQRFLALGQLESVNQTLYTSTCTLDQLKQAGLLPRLQIDTKRVTATVKTLQLQPDDKPILSLCPGSAFGPSKRWPPEYFAALAKAKAAQGYQVYLLGTTSDEAAAIKIQQASDHSCINLVGRTKLNEVVDILSLSQAVVSNDSGLMHIACALAVPVLALFGSSSPNFTPPLSDRAKTLYLNLECSPCFKRRCPLQHHRCLRDLMPNEVIRALDAIM